MDTESNEIFESDPIGQISSPVARRISYLRNRQESISGQPGNEGTQLAPKVYVGKSLGVLTSGGDSQGMNAAIRAVARMGIYLGCRVYTIKEGYEGLVDGGVDSIVEATWNSVSDIIQLGGTIIGSARSARFRERSGRLLACQHLVERNVTNLVIIGGDGSLTGANLFRAEWPELLKELLAEGKIKAAQASANPSINIVGLVGSIDNDFCGTDMTIGTDSALHRIIEAVDAVVSTAQSHQRTFVIEVMGRHCGYLALVAALATEADWVFIPEWPPSPEWPTTMCEKLSRMRQAGSRLNIVIVAEGAIDSAGTPVSSQQVADVIKAQLHFDTRVTVLGHVQRGGSPSAFDRLLGCRMGAEAVVTLMQMTSSTPPCVISVVGNQMVRVPLMQCVERTLQVQKAMNEKRWDEAVKLRGRSFESNLATYRLLTKIQPPKEKENLTGGHQFTMAVMTVGAPAGGMNAAVRSFVRQGLYHRCKVYAITDSFEGLVAGEFKEMKWGDVTNWTMEAGSNLGTRKETPEKILDKVAVQLKKFGIGALLIIGGFEAFLSALHLSQNRGKFKEFCIPILVIPATISNNVPGTNVTLGSDTALNKICSFIDTLKTSAKSTRKRVFVVETQGGHCGYLATMSGLASGADNAYIFEEPFTVGDIQSDVQVISQKMQLGVQRYVTIRNEFANENYSVEFIRSIFDEESHGLFSTRVSVLGHLQQGERPSPFDRNSATKLAARAAEVLIRQMNESLQADESVYTVAPETAVLMGVVDRAVVYTSVENLKKMTDFQHRIPKDQWWLKVRPLLRILAKHDEIYITDAMQMNELVGETHSL